MSFASQVRKQVIRERANPDCAAAHNRSNACLAAVTSKQNGRSESSDHFISSIRAERQLFGINRACEKLAVIPLKMEGRSDGPPPGH